MRAAVVFAVAGVALVASLTARAAQTATAVTALRIAYWSDGAGRAPDDVWTLRCGPTGGTLPRAARACRRLAVGGPTLFAPVPRDAVCTEIYGGPQTAHVVGLVEGRRIWATFTRVDGCQIARWGRVSPWLLPAGTEP